MTVFIKAVLAGLLIGFGGCAFLASPIPFAGAFMFATGLLSICVTGQYLYTGKICFANSGKAFLQLPFILVFNLLTAYGFGWAVHYMKAPLAKKAFEMCSTKLGEGLMVIPLGICCNTLIYFAVKCQQDKNSIGLIMCVMTFILCGFEHCVANAFYFGAGGIYGLPVLTYMGLNVLGNTIGGLLCLGCEAYLAHLEKKELMDAMDKAFSRWMGRTL